MGYAKSVEIEREEQTWHSDQEECDEEPYYDECDIDSSFDARISHTQNSDFSGRRGFFTKVAGVSIGNRQEIISKIVNGTELCIVREKDNSYDPNAVGIYWGQYQIGYIPRDVAAKIAPQIDGGQKFRIKVSQITGGGEKWLGVNVFIEKNIRGEEIMTNSSRFRNYLEEKNFFMEDGQLEDGTVFFRCHQKLQSGGEVLLVVTFEFGERVLGFKVFDIVHTADPLKTDAMHKLINEMNAEFRFGKFIEIDGHVSLLYNFRAQTEEVDPFLIMDTLISLFETTQECYPKFMKLED